MMRLTCRTAGAVAALVLVAAGLAGPWGCTSDTVAPHDALPVLTEDDSAWQASLAAVAVAEVAPQAVQFSTKAADKTDPPYHYYFLNEDEDGVSGDIALDFRLGGADGAHATYLTGDYVHIYTADPEGLIIESPLGGRIYIQGDLMADITRGTPDTAVILQGSGGALATGAYDATFAVQDLTVSESGYPSGGPLTFANGTHELSLMFDGTKDVEISLGGTPRWTFDMSDWALTPLP